MWEVRLSRSKYNQSTVFIDSNVELLTSLIRAVLGSAPEKFDV